jgi:hypothetical protein
MHYGWAAIGVIAALSLTHCHADRTGLLVGARVWRCEAMVRSSTVEEASLSSDDLSRLFVASPAAGEGEEFVRTQWRRYLGVVLDGTHLLPDDLHARLGEPPYCLLSDSVTPTAVFTSRRFADLLGREIDDSCSAFPPWPNCGNAAGVFPALSVTPGALAFADLPLGSPTAEMSVTYAIAGSGRLCLGTPMLDRSRSRHPADFVVDASGCAAAPGDVAWRGSVLSETRPSCQVVVRFNPLGPGARRAVLRASSNDPDMRVSQVPLTGTGIGGVLALSETSLCFYVPAAPEPGFAAPQHSRTVTLSNTGPGAVTVESVTAGGAGWSRQLLDVRGAPLETSFALAAGESVLVRVLEEEGTVASSTLIIDSNAATPHLEAALQGFNTGCTP